VRRVDRIWKILTSRSLTPKGKYDLFRILSRRQHKRSGLYPVCLPIGEAFVDGENARVDFQVLAQIFLDEVYANLEFGGSIVVDIGAHKGYFAAYALMSGAKAVLSYEPEAVNFSCLERFAESAKCHGLAIQVSQVAVSDTNGKITLYLSTESWRHSILSGRDLSSKNSLQVRSYTLANILRSAETEFLGHEFILKIDAEGVEGLLLVNTPAEYFSAVKEIIFEYHTFSGCDLQVILDRLRSFGFEYTESVRDADLHHFVRGRGRKLS
jgi:FkbM family methyltransferase